MESEYIIDFERVNELTTTIYDRPDQEPFGAFAHSVSRKAIKLYLDIYMNRNTRTDNNDKVLEAIENLLYNKILVSRADIRDRKINDVLE